ncbi:MAG TPA: hypothetical protein VM324_13940 [Egibacteraceae bacterium]|jgi:hypothetical protein|nr:hypothetical protein [Egibacteraceae bacterium]
MSEQPKETNVNHGEVHDRAGQSADPVGATSRWGKPVTIAGAVVVVLAILWAIFAGGWLF